MTLEWLPQNDLLGHRQTVAFVSHVGHNSAYEAAYHGVPVVAAPLVNDQPAVANKLSIRAKMAVIVNPRTADATTWQQAIEEVIKNPWYKGNATRVSRILRSRPKSPVETAASTVEQIFKEGVSSSHLHGAALDMDYFVLLSYDVLIVWILLISLLIFISWKVLYCTLKSCCRRGSKKQKTS